MLAACDSRRCRSMPANKLDHFSSNTLLPWTSPSWIRVPARVDRQLRHVSRAVLAHQTLLQLLKLLRALLDRGWPTCPSDRARTPAVFATAQGWTPHRWQSAVPAQLRSPRSQARCRAPARRRESIGTARRSRSRRWRRIPQRREPRESEAQPDVRSRRAVSIHEHGGRDEAGNQGAHGKPC